MMRELANDPFEYVAISLLLAKHTVVVKSVTSRTNQVGLPVGSVSGRN